MKTLTLTFILLLSNLVVTYAQAYEDEIRVFIPAFSGPDSIGINTSTFLNFQLFKTLRRKSPSGPKDQTFGHGTIVWREKKLPDQKHQIVEDLMKKQDLLAQVALWGKAWRYGDGLLVQAYLSLPSYHDYRKETLEVWKEYLKINGVDYEFILDIPSRRIRFTPFYLSQTFVNKFKSPLSIPVLNKPSFNSEEVGRVGLKVRAIQVEGDWVKVNSRHKKGWVAIPNYSNKPTEAIDFSASIIRVYRGDWEGAYNTLEKVISNPNTPISLKVDTLLIQARLLAEMGSGNPKKLHEAMGLSPYSHKVIAYLLMWHISNLKNELEKGREQGFLRELKRIDSLLKNKKYLFRPGDPFIFQLEKLVSNHKGGGIK